MFCFWWFECRIRSEMEWWHARARPCCWDIWWMTVVLLRRFKGPKICPIKSTWIDIHVVDSIDWSISLQESSIFPWEKHRDSGASIFSLQSSECTLGHSQVPAGRSSNVFGYLADCWGIFQADFPLVIFTVCELCKPWSMASFLWCVLMCHDLRIQNAGFQTQVPATHRPYLDYIPTSDGWSPLGGSQGPAFFEVENLWSTWPVR